MPLNVLSVARAGLGFRLVLPGAIPTKGNRPTPVRPGLVLPSKPYRDWLKRTEYDALVLWSRLRQAGAILPWSQPLLAQAYVYLPTRARGDEDNYHKAIGDWLQKRGFVANDRLIKWGDGCVALDRQEPRLELVITPRQLRPGEI
jgi:hypothetical protein